MASQELRKRANWQTISGAKALKTEELFQMSLQNALDSVFQGQFLVERHPREFRDITLHTLYLKTFWIKSIT